MKSDCGPCKFGVKSFSAPRSRLNRTPVPAIRFSQGLAPRRRNFGVKSSQRVSRTRFRRNSPSRRASSRASSGVARSLMAKRIAAIDVGTNSIHMIVAEARPRRGYRVVDREKDMVQLGLSSLDGQPFTEEAIE